MPKGPRAREPAPAQNVAPVVNQSLGQERERLRPSVGRVDCDVGQRLARPPERDRRRRRLPRAQEGDRGDQHEHLIQRAAEHRDELTEEPEDHVAGLVEDEVDPVDEPRDAAAPERQPLRHRLPREAQQDQEAEGAGGDGGGVQASRFGGLMP